MAYWRARCLVLLRLQKVGECKLARVRCWLVRDLGHLNQDHKLGLAPHVSKQRKHANARLRVGEGTNLQLAGWKQSRPNPTLAP